MHTSVHLTHSYLWASFVFGTGNVILDDIDVPLKNWRNKDIVHNDMAHAENGHNGEAHRPDGQRMAEDSANAVDPFPQQHPYYKSVSIFASDDSFNVPMYILVVLTLAVVALFLNSYRKRRANIRPRRKYYGASPDSSLTTSLMSWKT